MKIRNANPEDFPAIRSVQALCPEASQWKPWDNEVLVAEWEDGRIAGFLVWRMVAADEAEILNLAVEPTFRRRGMARRMIAALTVRTIFLEVRESNHTARALYGAAGFKEAGTRPSYYQNPPESAIVMRFQS